MPIDFELIQFIEQYSVEIDDNSMYDDIEFPSVEFLNEFAAALRSGTYHQTRGSLGRIIGDLSYYCAAGVACKVGKRVELVVNDKIRFDNRVGIPSSDFLDNGFSYLLVLLNDGYKLTFLQIADIIEFIAKRKQKVESNK